jgi:hypothetical protein
MRYRVPENLVPDPCLKMTGEMKTAAGDQRRKDNVKQINLLSFVA